MSTTDVKPTAAAETADLAGRKPGLFARAFATKGPGDERSAGILSKITLVIVVVLFLLPTVGLLVTSFRNPAEANSTGWWSVFTTGGMQFGDCMRALASLVGPEFEGRCNYAEVMGSQAGGSTLLESFINSAVVAVPATIIPILIAAFAAYAFSWMDFKGREILFVIFVGLLVVPLQVAFIPIIQLTASIDRIIPGDFRIQGSFFALWLAHAGFGMPLAVYLLRNYIGSLPREVIESAKVDGASHFQTFWRLIIPLSVPALAAFAIFQFLWTWNDYLVALILLDSATEGQVATTYLAQLQGTFGERLHLLTAGAFVTMTVPLVVFFSLQRFFVRGLTAGSVKG